MTEAYCLAILIFFEARSEPMIGQFAAAQTAINRVADERYPDTICEVVWQRKQFSFTHDGQSDDPEKYTAKADKKAWRRAKTLADHLIENKNLYDFSGDATHYYNPYIANPDWADERAVVKQIGNHVFIRCTGTLCQKRSKF